MSFFFNSGAPHIQHLLLLCDFPLMWGLLKALHICKGLIPAPPQDRNHEFKGVSVPHTKVLRTPILYPLPFSFVTGKHDCLLPLQTLEQECNEQTCSLQYWRTNVYRKQGISW